MADYIIKSPNRRSDTPQYVKLGVSGTSAEYQLGVAVTLTQAEVDQLNEAGYHPILLDGSGNPAPASTSLSDDALDAAPASVSSNSPAHDATTIVVTHTVPLTPTGFGKIDVYRSRGGTVSKVISAGTLETSPDTIAISAVVLEDDHWCDVWFGGSAKQRSATVYAKHPTPAIDDSPAITAADTTVAGTADADSDDATLTLYGDGVALGTDVISAGAWSIAGLTLTEGMSLTAKIAVGTNYVSAASTAVVVDAAP